MRVVLDKPAISYLKRLNEPLKTRIRNALLKLSHDPPEGDIRKLIGRDGYRVRVGDYRILFDITETEVMVYDIGPRGQIYKEN